MALKAAFLLAIALLLGQLAMAAEFRLRLDQGGCPGYKRVSGRWVRMSAAESARIFPAGSNLNVRTFGSRSDQYLATQGGQSYSLKTSCFSKATSGFAAGGGSSSYGARDGARDSFFSGGKLYLQVGFQGWQETLNAVDGTGTQLSTISNNVGICPGVGFRKNFRKDFDWDVNTCLFLGGSDATIQGGTVGVLGLFSAASVEWTPIGQTAQFGFGIPILYRHQTVSGGDSATTIDAASSLQTGLQLETRFALGPHFTLDPRSGYFLGTKRFFWDLNVSYTL